MKQTIEECRQATEKHFEVLETIYKQMRSWRSVGKTSQIGKMRDVIGDVVEGLVITESKLSLTLKELKKPVKLEVYRGCVEVRKIPRGVKVVINDKDVEETSTLVSDNGSVVELSRR